jgi:RNA polymerase sigma-70 factor (ECF subfamily)
MGIASRVDRFDGLTVWTERYLDGDARALRHVYAMLAPTIRRHVQARVRDAARIDDVVQLTFIKAHRSRASLGTREHLDDAGILHWYLAIARNTAIDEARASRRRARRKLRLQHRPDHAEGFAPASCAPDPQQNLIERERRATTAARVRAAIAELPASMRQVVVLNKLRGVPIEAIAANLQVRPGPLRVRAHRAYRRLAEALSAGDTTTARAA